MSRPLEYEWLGPKRIMRVPEEATHVERLYGPLNELVMKGERPDHILRETERLLTLLSQLPERENLCEILSSFCDQLSDVEA